MLIRSQAFMQAIGDNEPVVLIDGYGFVFRAYHSLPPLTRKDGTPVGAVYGFASMLLKLLQETKTLKIAVILDAGQKNFRHDLYVDYKANRPPAPEDLKPQFPLIREVAKAFNLPIIEKVGYEADDIIATIATQAAKQQKHVIIVSSDKDLMQLVSPFVSMFDAVKSKKIGPEEVFEKFGVTPEQVPEVLALIGDSSDNIPGVPGIGPKTAAELINIHHSLATLLENLDSIPQQKRREQLKSHIDKALLSYQLVLLNKEVPEVMLDTIHASPIDPKRLEEFFRQQQFNSLVPRIKSLIPIGIALPDTDTEVSLEDAPGALTHIPVILRSSEMLRTWLDKIHSGVVGVELISSSSPSNLPIWCLSHEIAGIAIIPCQKPEPSLFAEAVPTLTIQETLAVLKPFLQQPSHLTIGFDLKEIMAQVPELEIAPYDDVMVMAYVLRATTVKPELESVAEVFLSIDKNELSLPKQLASDAWSPDILAIMAKRASVLHQLHRLLKKELFIEKLLTLYETIERPLIQVLATMEREGILIDKGFLHQLSRQFGERLSTLETEIFKLAGCQFSIASTKQLGEVLFEKLQIPSVSKTTKTKSYSTDADTLETLALQGFEIAQYLLEWRQLTKLMNTYTDALPKQINPITQRVHTHFSMTATSTGRLSSSDPNLQNIPIRSPEGQMIRKAFVASPGTSLISADYSQIELRLLASIADISTLQDAFKEGVDIHALTASQIFKVPLATVDSTMRRRAKAINFGIIYGMSAFGLAKQLNMTQSEASTYIKAYFIEYPGIEAYLEKTKHFAREHGFVCTLFGRKCFIPGIQDKNPAIRQFSERAAINAPLQGSAADIIKKAMIAIDKRLKAESLSSKMVLQVHDELLLEVPPHEMEYVKEWVKQTMEQIVTLSVPLVANIGIGQNWGDAH